MSKKVSEAKILKQSALAEGIYDMVLDTPLSADAAPGQFVALYCSDSARLLPRPISICDADKTAGTLRLVYRVVGEGTDEFSKLKDGDSVKVLGVLGNGYPLDEAQGKRVLLVGGGLGVPPLLFLAKELTEHLGTDRSSPAASPGTFGPPASVTAVMGYRNLDLRFLNDDFSAAADTIETSDDGSFGFRGTVVDAIRDKDLSFDIAYACGPFPMLRALASYCKDKNIKCYVSLEERMACGVGVCLGCVAQTAHTDEHSRVNNARVCTEGPVFDSEDVAW